MKRMRSFLALLVLLALPVFGQSTNYLAQGKYYSAKKALEEKNYAKAIEYIGQCKTLLQNGSNQLVQYIHIIAAYKLGNYEEARRELQRFFALVEGGEKPVTFSKSVEELTTNEITDITKLIDPIDEALAGDKKAKAAAAEAERIRKIREPYDNALAILRSFTSYYIITGDDGTVNRPSFSDGITVDGSAFYFPHATGSFTYGERPLNDKTRSWLTGIRGIQRLTRASKTIPFSGITGIEYRANRQDSSYMTIRIHTSDPSPYKLDWENEVQLEYQRSWSKAEGTKNTFGRVNSESNVFLLIVDSSIAARVVEAMKIVMQGVPKY